ncbi:Ldh family oxidoreductase, partial [Chromohalobacter sp. 296-RDG]|uniref:Ldh family oxidoreductase n=1 Tax=Chromohalobacter sp. 296-RDG TaxID=2994062 RepID=UPI002468A77C
AEQWVVLPLGGPKGSALAIMNESLCGVLGGGCFASSMGNLYTDFDTLQDIGHFFLVIDTSRTHLSENYAERVPQLRDELKASAPAEGFSSVKMPGEVEIERAAQMSDSGITLPTNMIDDLNETARQLGAATPAEYAAGEDLT